MVDRRNHHLFQPLLYQVATASLAPSEIAWPIRYLLRERREVTTVLASVEAVDKAARCVTLDEFDSPLRDARAGGELYAAAAGHGLSAAALKLASLREERRQATVSTAAANPTLAPAVPTDASASGTGKSVQIELSWAAPAQPVPVEFFVQVLALDTGGAHRVFTSFSKQSAVLVSLPRVPAVYAWRVYTVAASVPDYAPSAWS